MRAKITNRRPDKDDADKYDRVLRWGVPFGRWDFVHYKLIELGDTWMRPPHDFAPVRDEFWVNRYTDPSGRVTISSTPYSTKGEAENVAPRSDFETIRLRRVLDGDPKDMNKLLGAIHDLERCETWDGGIEITEKQIRAVIEASRPGGS